MMRRFILPPILLGVALFFMISVATASSGPKLHDVDSLIDGWIINETMSPIGDNFYNTFTKRWSKPKGANGFVITIKEHPIPTSRFSSRITVKIGGLFDNRIIYRNILSPRQTEIKKQVDQTIANINGYIEQKQRAIARKIKRLAKIQKMQKWEDPQKDPLYPGITSRNYFWHYAYSNLKELSHEEIVELQKKLLLGEYELVEVTPRPYYNTYDIQYKWVAFEGYDHRYHIAPAWKGEQLALRVSISGAEKQIDVFVDSGNIGERKSGTSYQQGKSQLRSLQ